MSVHHVSLVITALKEHDFLLNFLVSLEHIATTVVLELHQNVWIALEDGIVRAMDRLSQLHCVLLDTSVLRQQ